MPNVFHFLLFSFLFLTSHFLLHAIVVVFLAPDKFGDIRTGRSRAGIQNGPSLWETRACFFKFRVVGMSINYSCLAYVYHGNRVASSLRRPSPKAQNKYTQPVDQRPGLSGPNYAQGSPTRDSDVGTNRSENTPRSQTLLTFLRRRRRSSGWN